MSRVAEIEITPSQLENVWVWDKDACVRRWVFRSVRKLPVISSHSTAFGDVLHKVIERYLHDGTDQHVELYPEGWTRAVDRFGHKGDTVSPGEAHQIQKLVQAAKDSGQLYRAPNRLIEHPFEFWIEFWPGRWARVHGFMDLVIPPDELWDHKSGKNRSKKKSPARVKAAPQMLTMGYALWLKSGKSLDRIKVQHLFFCKDPEDPLVAPVPAFLERADLLLFESRLKDMFQRMTVLREAVEKEAPEFTKFDAGGYHSIPLPEGGSACFAFGGCKFEPLCSSTYKHVDQYIASYNAQKLNPETPLTPPAPVGNVEHQEETPMTDGNIFMQRVAARAALHTGGGAPAPAAPPPAAPAKPVDDPTKWPSHQAGLSDAKGQLAVPVFVPPGQGAPVEAAATATQAQPKAAAARPENVPAWWKPGCPACNGGWKRDGSFLPCRVCDATAKSRGALNSEAFVIEPDGAGGVVWEPKEGIVARGGHKTGLAGLQVEVKRPPVTAPPTPPPSESPPVPPEPPAPQGPVALQKLVEGPTKPPEVQGPPQVSELPAPVRTVREALAEPEDDGEEGEEENDDETPAKPGRGRKPGSKNKPKAPIVVAPPAEVIAQAMAHQAPVNFRLVGPAIPPEKRKGLTLIVNCQVQGLLAAGAKSLDQIFHGVGVLLAQSQQLPTYHHVSGQVRRDAVAANAEAVALIHDGQVIVGHTDTPDLVAFAAALRPYCLAGYVNGGAQ